MDWNTAICSMLDSFRGIFSLSIKFRSLLDNYKWWLTGVYDPCVANLKCNFLDELRHLQTIVGHHWVLGVTLTLLDSLMNTLVDLVFPLL